MTHRKGKSDCIALAKVTHRVRKSCRTTDAPRTRRAGRISKAVVTHRVRKSGFGVVHTELQARIEFGVPFGILKIPGTIELDAGL